MISTKVKQAMPPGAVVGAEPHIIADELVMHGEFAHRPCASIRASYTNRKKFNTEALQRLAENIAEMGVAQPILIRSATPTADAPEEFEIVAGERRWRASVMAGIALIPSMLRVLSDKQALEIQIVENLQREDPHPQEEADGYQQLMLNHGYTADQLADKVKKSRSYIYGRLKLCALATSVREMFLNDKFSAATALLIARLPTPAMQAKAVGEITRENWAGEQMSYRGARDHLRRNYMLDLKDAIFAIKDANLIADAGSCIQCPKRTGNQPEVFPDEKNGNVCTDPDCYNEKRSAHSAKAKTLAESKGQIILSDEDARKIMPNNYGDLRGGYVDLDKEFHATGGFTTYRKILGKHTPEATLLENPHVPGVLLKVAKVSEVEALILQHGGTIPETSQARTAKERAKEKEQEAEAKIEREYRRRLFVATRDAGMANAAPWDERHVAELLYRQSGSTERATIVKLYGWDESALEGSQENGKWISRSKKICAAIHQLDANQVRQLIRDLTLATELAVHTYTGDRETPARMIAAAAQFDINARSIRAAVTAEAKAKATPKEKGKPAAKTKKSPPPAQADLPAIDAIDVTIMASTAGIREFIIADPARLNELSNAIVLKAPHQLATFENVADALGYAYSATGWGKVDATPAAVDSAAPTAATTVRPKLSAKPKAASSSEPQGPIVRIKPKRKSVEVWPFKASGEPAGESFPASENKEVKAA